MKSLRWATVICLALSLSVPVAASAGANSKTEDRTVRVSYADLDVRSSAGARILYARLKQASNKACGVDTHRVLGSIQRVSHSKQCYRELLDRFVNRVDSDELERLHNS